ncbi:hypothetical protein VTN49DRAFT_5917 [Thermomyces lanuginosus]|uniref:uncharacterized protein n=1 Tax=Thermomyces lanuginosus TaxID=5541 RepID=UPI0037435B9D
MTSTIPELSLRLSGRQTRAHNHNGTQEIEKSSGSKEEKENEKERKSSLNRKPPRKKQLSNQTKQKGSWNTKK